MTTRVTALMTDLSSGMSFAAATLSEVVTFNATTMSVNCGLSNVFRTTLTANVTVAPSFPIPTDGQTIN